MIDNKKNSEIFQDMERNLESMASDISGIASDISELSAAVIDMCDFVADAASQTSSLAKISKIMQCDYWCGKDGEKLVVKHKKCPMEEHP